MTKSQTGWSIAVCLVVQILGSGHDAVIPSLATSGKQASALPRIRAVAAEAETRLTT